MCTVCLWQAKHGCENYLIIIPGNSLVRFQDCWLVEHPGVLFVNSQHNWQGAVTRYAVSKVTNNAQQAGFIDTGNGTSFGIGFSLNPDESSYVYRMPLFSGFKFGSSAFFPGACDAPEDPEKTHAATLFFPVYSVPISGPHLSEKTGL